MNSIKIVGVHRLVSGVPLAISPLAAAILFWMGQPAMAGSCTPAPVSTCAGAASAGDSTQYASDSAPISITVQPGFGLNVTDGGYGFDISGQSGITFTDIDAASIRTNGAYGIYANNAGSGSINVTATGALMSSGTLGDGLRSYNTGLDTRIQVHDAQGDGSGMVIDHQGTGAVDIRSTGALKGRHQRGLYTYIWSGTSLSIATVDTEGGFEGIFAHNQTSGALTITSSGLAKGVSGYGILADNQGTDVRITAADTEGGGVGIGVNNRGSGVLAVDSRGTAIGGVTGLMTYSAPSSTHATVSALDTTGGYRGIEVIHEGKGAVSVASTGTATGRSGEGLYVQTGSDSTALTLTARHVTGGTDGIKTSHRSTAGTPGNTATVIAEGRVMGGSGYGIATESAPGVLTRIHVRPGAVVGSSAGGAISNNEGDSEIDIAAPATVQGRISLGAGSDTLTLSSGLGGLTVLDGGGGGRDVLNLSNANEVRLGSDIRNWTVFNLDQVQLALTGGSITVGSAGDMSSGIFLRNGSTLDGRQDNLSVIGNLSLAAGTQFLATGHGGGRNVVSGSVRNAGRMSTVGGAAGDILRIGGNYMGQDGLVVLETKLGDDTSLTDRLDIGGSTSGTSRVQVVNVGGQGAATREGIKIISVGGASDGHFTLIGDYVLDGVPSVVAGAYSYQLRKGQRNGADAGDWFLRSEYMAPAGPTSAAPTPVGPATAPPKPLYQPGVPTYEAYPQALLALNTLSTLQQRVGNRHWRAGPAERSASSDVDTWMRIEGGHTRIKPNLSTAAARLDLDAFSAQVGVERVLRRGQHGDLYAGLTGHYTQGTVKIQSPYGDGRIRTRGYGAGATLTWYGHTGFYIDNQLQVTRYRSDLRARLGNPDLASGNKGLGYAFSIEAGRRLALNDRWSMTPQAQLVYSHVDFDRFVDPYGAKVSRAAGASLQGRLGVALEHQSRSQTASGRDSRIHAYGIANLYYEFLNGSRVMVDRTRVNLKKDRLWGGLGVGGSYSWRDDTYAVYAEGLVSTSLNRVGKSHAVQGKIGFRIRW